MYQLKHALSAVLLLGVSGCLGDVDTIPAEENPDENVVSSAAAVPGNWNPPANVRAAGAVQFIRYDSPPAWDGGRSCSPGFLEGTSRLGGFLLASFPGRIDHNEGYNCRPNTTNMSEMSVHGVGRALDVHIPQDGSQADNGRGDAIANWLIENAQTIGVQYIIWDRTEWQGDQGGDKLNEYTGTNPHINHIHVELTHDGAGERTPWFMGGDIGIAANGAVWGIGSHWVAGGDSTVYQWNGSSWVATTGNARHVAVEPDGTPWVVKNNGQIYRRVGTGWQLLPGLANDIAIGTDGVPWVIGHNSVPGGFGVFRWNGSGWTQIDGGALRIAIAPPGIPWVINDRGEILSRNGNLWQLRPGFAHDIGIASTGAIFVTGGHLVPGGYAIFRWNGSSWIQTDGGARRVAVAPNGRPWVVNDRGEVYSQEATGWQRR